jgi:hypothetical protein
VIVAQKDLEVSTIVLRSRLLLVLTVLVVAVAPAAGKTPRKTCKAACGPLVETTCAGLKKKKAKRCRERLWRQCQRDRISCESAATTTTTTLPPSAPSCPTTFQVGPELPGGAEHVAVADLNRDGKLDMVMTANPGVMVRLGNGDGSLGGVSGADAGGDPGGVAVADLDGDGIPDLAVPHFVQVPSQAVEVSVLIGRGDGSFAEPVSYPVGTRDFHDVVAADFNGDGRPDLAVATHPAVVVLLNAGNGTFGAKVDYPAATTGRAVAVADLNRDGKLDLAATGGGPPGGRGVVAVLLGDGSGAFASPVTYEVGRFPYSIVAADVDGDGAIDLATANNNSADLSVLLDDGNGTFRTRVEYDAGGLPTSLAGGDFNADGRTDFVISAGPNATVGLFTGRGGGTFADVVGTFTGGSAALAAGDFDGDGRDDVALANGRAHRVLLSRCP